MPSPNSYALIEIKHAEPAGMSRLAQNRTLWGQAPMSALPPKVDIGTQSRNARFVPIADVTGGLIDYFIGAAE
jgi:hypothetical protein